MSVLEKCYAMMNGLIFVNAELSYSSSKFSLCQDYFVRLYEAPRAHRDGRYGKLTHVLQAFHIMYHQLFLKAWEREHERM